MPLHPRWRAILVFCICVSAVLTIAPRASNAQLTPPPANPTPNAFFTAIQTMNAQQNAVAARPYVAPVSTAQPRYFAPRPFPTPVRPVRSLGPTTSTGHAPAAFHQAVRSIELQQNAPGSSGTYYPAAPGYRPAAPAPQPTGQFRTAAAPPPQAISEQAGETAPRNVTILSTDYLLSYPQNAWRIISAPYNFDTNDWLVAGGVAATTGVLLLADKELNDTWRDDIRTGTLDDFLDVMEYFGDSKFIIFGSLGGYALGELVGSDRDQEAALLVAQSFVLSAGLTQGLKFAFRRDRPDDSRDDQYSFFSSDSSKTNSSFPSGHATNAFSMAAVLTNVYDESVPWLGWVLYPIATMTSLARVNNERHWGSDVFLGSALGYFIGRMVVRYSPFRGSQTVSIEPMSGGDLNGLRIVHKI